MWLWLKLGRSIITALLHSHGASHGDERAVAPAWREVAMRAQLLQVGYLQVKRAASRLCRRLRHHHHCVQACEGVGAAGAAVV